MSKLSRRERALIQHAIVRHEAGVYLRFFVRDENGVPLTVLVCSVADLRRYSLPSAVDGELIIDLGGKAVES